MDKFLHAGQAQTTLSRLDLLNQSFSYNADGTINYAEATDGINTWRQTYSYSAGRITGITSWVKQ